MNAQGHKIHIYCLSAAVLTLIAATLRTLCFGLAFDAGIGYFAAGAALPLFLRVLETVTVLCFFTLLFFIPKGTLPVAAKTPVTLPRRLISGAVALLFALNFVVFCRYNTGRGLPVVIFVLGVLTLLGAVAFFALPLFGVTRTDLTVTFGVLTVVALVCLTAFTYFDSYTPMNAPHKTGLHLAAVAVLFYILYMLRDAAGVSMPRAKALSALVSFFATFTVGVSDLLAYPMGAFTDPAYLCQDLLLIGLAVFIGANTAAEVAALAPSAGKENRQ